MLFTMIPHSWQQTQNDIAWKLGEMLQYMSSCGLAKMAQSSIFFEICIFSLMKTGIPGVEILWSLV